MNDAFKKVTAAIEGDPVLNEICKLAFQAGAEDAREQMKAEVEALRAFHSFFMDRCEALFSTFGMPAVDLFNAAARPGEKHAG